MADSFDVDMSEEAAEASVSHGDDRDGTCLIKSFYTPGLKNMYRTVAVFL